MAQETTSYRDVLDIIFSGRNKKYGAYELRRNANKYLGRALIIGLALIILAFMAPLIANRMSDMVAKAPIDVEIELAPPPDIDINEPPPPPPPPPPTPPPPTRSTVKFVPPVIKKDEEVIKEKPKLDLEELKEKDEDIGAKDKKGDDEAEFQIIDNPTDLKPIEEVKKAPVEDNKILDFVEKSAAFPGGEAEMMKFLQENISYPAIARENNITGRVILRFVVEKNGSITDVQVVRKLGGGCDEEAVRVVKKMPKWNPANQNGNPVRQRYTLPVFFKLAG